MRPVTLFLLAAVLGGCRSEPALETETFTLNRLRGDEAADLIKPYAGAAGAVTARGSALTVQATPERLDQVREVLRQLDRVRPAVRLHFQLIEADGPSKADPAIADVEAELRKLFRYEGYRLLNEAVVGGAEGSSIEQIVGKAADSFQLNATIGEVRGSADSGTVQLQVGVRSNWGSLSTTVNARAGQTLVVGNAQLVRGGGTLILTVRPDLVR
ncbi:MAG: hypothetical protein AB7S39_05690 [Gemmatimonadales bacterium]